MTAKANVITKKIGDVTIRFHAKHYIDVWQARLRAGLPYEYTIMTPEKKKVHSLIKRIDNGDETLIGKPVLVRSNEPDDLIVGTLIGFVSKHRLPLVKEIETGKEWTCMGGVILYNTELHMILKQYPPIEQWNLCSETAGGEYFEKKGVSYRTFSKSHDGFSLHADAFEDEL